ncbi:MAG: beta-glucosidase BglX [Gemmatimonadales bacterium]
MELLALCAALGTGCTAPPSQTAKSSAAVVPVSKTGGSRADAFVDSLLATLTLEEKLGQLSQYSGFAAVTGPGAAEASMEQLRQGGVSSFLNVTGADSVRKLQRIAIEDTRTRIPLLFGHDVIHGMRTIFPIPLAEASSWNPDAVREAARIAAREASAYGINWTFAPMVDVARDPRWGRITEGSGEDPYLGSVMGAARVRGFQGDDLRARESIAATVKHFAAYGGAEGGRDYNVVDVSERGMREVFLPPFRAAACAGAATFMASFNEIAGVPAHANRWLLTDLLRGEWGFDGVVVGDWGGVAELIPHGIAADSAEAARRSLEAGVDIEMVSGTYSRNIPRLVRSGAISQAAVDQAVRRVLRFKQRLGLFQDPYRGADAGRERSEVLTPAHRAAARHLAQQSIVLLRNEDNTLPLSRDLRTIAVVGALAADSVSTLGSWAGIGRAADAVSVLDGIRRAVSPRTRVIYERGTDPTRSDTSRFRAAMRAARTADAVILVVGEPAWMSGEAESRASIELPGAQLELAQRIRALGKPLVVVLMNGRPLAVPWLAENAPALVEAWFLGVEMGNALSDVLFGAVNPSGKLTVTFPRSVGQIPLYYNHRRTGRPPAADSKWNSKYIDLPWTPQFPFGFGLSYTSYTYSSPRLSSETMGPRDSLRVEVTVTNTGRRAGEEIVQLYVQDEIASVTRPVIELRRFRRVPLGAGESRTVRFSLGLDDLAFYDTRMRRVAEPGSFRVFVGGSSRDVNETRFRFVTPDNNPVSAPESCAAVGN